MRQRQQEGSSNLVITSIPHCSGDLLKRRNVEGEHLSVTAPHNLATRIGVRIREEMVEGVRRRRILSAGNGTATTTTSGCRCSEDGAGEAFSSLASSGDRSCQTQSGLDGVIPSSSKVGCVPLTYGRGCAPHDAFYDGGSRPWCYVTSRDGCTADEGQRIYASYFFESAEDTLYYSYTACGGEDWTDRLEREKTLGGATVLAATPQAYFPPYHYKRGPDGGVLSAAGDEYWNTSVPYEGVMVDYLRELQDLSGGDFEVEWTHGSRASKRVHPSSAYTASVQDIADGTVDLAVGPIWITAERLQLAQYTMIVDYSRTVLIIPRPGVNTSLSQQVSKVLEPFAPSVWLLMVLVILITAILSVWFSPNRKSILAKAEKSSTNRSRYARMKAYSRLGIDEFLSKGTFFFSAGVEQDPSSSLPVKLLMFGFAFFICILISAYVANLAAFLTRNKASDSGPKTIEEAIKGNYKICALTGNRGELEVAWPAANFIWNESGKSYVGLVEDYDNGLCDVLIYGFANIDLMNMLCERDLVFTDSLVIENPVAFPVKTEYQAGLSYWMYQAEKTKGITVESLKKEYDRTSQVQPDCVVNLSQAAVEESDEFAQVTLENLFLPFIFYASFATLASCLQFYARWMGKKGRRGLLDSSYLGRQSTLGLGKKSRRRLTYEKDDSSDEKYAEEFPDTKSTSRNKPGIVQVEPPSVSFAENGHAAEAQETGATKRTVRFSLTEHDDACSVLSGDFFDCQQIPTEQRDLDSTSSRLQYIIELAQAELSKQDKTS